MIGRELAHFRILSLVAAGGMGEVYRARDTHLERDVAIKLLPPDLFADAEARRRFRREALSLSRLNHPHIAVVYDFAEQDGVPYLVMELIEGESLDRLLARGPLAEAVARRLGTEVAAALAAAHEQGVVHRDLKPANIMVSPSGGAKVVDFGVARRVPRADDIGGTTLTATAQFAGTPAYMAPEQILGQRVDARTDLFALGLVLYEAVTGKRAFAGETVIGLASSILNDTPPGPRELRGDLSPEFERVILRCLEKRPEARFGSAEEVREAITSGTRPATAAAPTGGDPVAATAPGSRPPAAGLRPGRLKGLATAGLVVAAAGAVVALGMFTTRWRGCHGGGETVNAIAVLPLSNLSGDPEQEYFADGMTDELIVSLSQLRDLRVISRASSASYRGTTKSARQIGRELRVGALVMGSVQRSGGRVRIRAQVVEARTDRSVWAESFEGDLGEALDLQRRVARALAERVHPRLGASDRRRLEARRRVNPEAYEAYLRGVHYWNEYTTEGWRKSLGQFDRAIELEPEYAPAHAHLAHAYLMLGANVLDPSVSIPRARAAALRALALDSTLAAGHAALGYIQAILDHDWASGERSLQRALELNPNEATAHQNFGDTLHVRGRFDEALEEFERARAIDPLSSYVATMTLWPLNQGRRFEEAVARARALMQADTSMWYPRFILGQALCYSGRAAEGIPEIEAVLRRDDIPVVRGWLGWAYALGGRRADARRVLAELDSLATRSYVNPFAFAIVRIGLGDHEAALGLLEQAAEQRSEEVIFVGVDPAMDPLRDSPRFDALLRRLGLWPPPRLRGVPARRLDPRGAPA